MKQYIKAIWNTISARGQQLGIGKLVLLSLFLLALYFPIFLHLDYLPIQLYDESRRAINALEMTGNGNLLVTYYDGKPDMWGKPPMPIWFMALSMQIFGFDELGLRLPSALIGLAIAFILFHFSNKYLKNPMLGIFSALILVSSRGFIREHVVRTADYDVYLCLWSLSYTLLFFLYTETDNPSKQRKYLYWTAILLACAVLTKGIAGLFFAPGLAIFALLRRKVPQLLRSKHTYFAIALFSICVGSYYLLRDMATPYYWNTVVYNEVTGRYFKGFEGHQHGPFYYLQLLYEDHFKYWIYLLPVGIALGLNQKGPLSRFSLYLTINTAILLSVISLSKTQLSWYDAPLIPFFAVLSAIPIVYGFNRILKIDNQLSGKQSILILTFTLLLYAWPYSKIIQTVYFPSRDWSWNQKDLYGYFIRSHPEINTYMVCNIGYNAASKFYRTIKNKEGYVLGTFHPGRKQPQGATVLICEKEAKKIVRNVHYVYKYMDWKDCELLKITGIKH